MEEYRDNGRGKVQTSYDRLSDEALLRQLRSGDTAIMDYVLDKYKPLVRKKANAMFLIGGDTDDLIQEGMIGLFKAIRDYREERETSFFHFAELCITRQIDYLSGLNYQQIAEKMKKSPKAIDNALQRIKTKIRVFQNDTLPS